MSEPKPLFAPLKPRQAAARIWHHGAFVVDQWRHIGDAEPVPARARVIVSLGRWRAERTTLESHADAIGVRLEPAEAIDATSDGLQRLALVVLPVPKFSDGRSYSTARRLRQAGYRGEIRATGDVLLDQIPLLLRSGFDAFEITHAATQSALERGTLPAVTRAYQVGAEIGSSGAAFTLRPPRTPSIAADRDTATG